jgi:hypothetical protein
MKGAISLLYYVLKRLRERIESIWLFIKKWKERTWIAIGVIVQIFVAFLILSTVINTNKNIREQGQFYRNSLRPWIHTDFDTTENPIVIDDSGVVRCNYEVKNTGTTPACYVKTYALMGIDTSVYFPVEDFIAKIKADIDPKSIFVFPGEQIKARSNMAQMTKAEYMFTPPFVKLETIRTKQEVLDIIDSLGMLIYIYQIYSDFAKNSYALRSTFYVRYDEIIEDSMYNLVFFKIYNDSAHINMLSE